MQLSAACMGNCWRFSQFHFSIELKLNMEPCRIWVDRIDSFGPLWRTTSNEEVSDLSDLASFSRSAARLDGKATARHCPQNRGGREEGMSHG
jgi:hypothetical protein